MCLYPLAVQVLQRVPGVCCWQLRGRAELLQGLRQRVSPAATALGEHHARVLHLVASARRKVGVRRVAGVCAMRWIFLKTCCPAKCMIRRSITLVLQGTSSSPCSLVSDTCLVVICCAPLVCWRWLPQSGWSRAAAERCRHLQALQPAVQAMPGWQPVSVPRTQGVLQ